MGNLYTISDLCQLLSVTRPIVEKKLKRLFHNQPIPYTSTTVNNRDIKAIELSEKQLSMLGISDIDHTCININNDTPINAYSEPIRSANNNDELIFKIIDQSNEYVTRIESYTQRIIDAESQVKLLTIIENNKDAEINELRAKNKHLESENQELKQQLQQEQNKPFWKKKVL